MSEERLEPSAGGAVRATGRTSGGVGRVQGLSEHPPIPAALLLRARSGTQTNVELQTFRFVPTTSHGLAPLPA